MSVPFIVAALLTLVVYSYLVGDNPAYRAAQHLFVGVSVGIAVLVAFYNVVWPQLLFLYQQKDTFTIFTNPSLLFLFLSLILGVVLLFKLTLPRNAASNSVLGIILGTGAAVALAGALIGTLIPQALATMVPLNGNGTIPSILGNVVLVVGVVTTLSYFYFTGRKDGSRGPVAQYGATLGRYFIMIAFGAIFGLLTVSFFAALYGRIFFLANPS